MDEEIDGRTDGRTEGPVDDGRTDGRTGSQTRTQRHIYAYNKKSSSLRRIFKYILRQSARSGLTA